MKFGVASLRVGVGILVACVLIAGWSAPTARSAAVAKPEVTLLKAGLGMGGGAYSPPVTVGGWTYFAGTDGVHGQELWKTDGTTAGTVMVKDIGPNVRRPRNPLANLRVLGNGVAFTIDDGVHGREVWISDGTAAGTVMVKDVNPGGGGAPALSEAEVLRGEYYFIAEPVAGDRRMFKTDGTAEGTMEVHPGPVNFLFLTPHVLFYGGADPDPGGAGHELWRTDGTPEGTVMVKDINPGPDSGYPTVTARVGGLVYLTADDGVHGRELWRSDGTSEGTMMVKDIDPGGSGLASGAAMAVAGDVLYFTADDGIHGEELWKSDGTEAGTTMVRDIQSQPGYGPRPFVSQRAVVGDQLFFGASPAGELWRTDGTDAGTVRLLPFPHDEPLVSYGVSDWVAFGSHLYFATTSDDKVHGAELWRTDGTSAGTELVIDSVPGPGSSYPYTLTVAGDSLLFSDVGGLKKLTHTYLEPTVPPNRFVLPPRGEKDRRKGKLALSVTLPAAGRLEVAAGRFTKPVTLDLAASGVVAVLIEPNRAGKRKLKAKLLRARRQGGVARLRVTVTMTFTPLGGAPYAVTAVYRLRRG